MNRLEELAQRVLDGSLTDAEAQELDQLLDSSPEAQREFRQLLQVEVELRNLDEHLDVSDAVMARIQAPAQPELAPVRDPLPQRPDRVILESPLDRWFLRVAVPLAAAAGIVLAFVLFNQQPYSDSTEVPATAATSVVEGVQVVRKGEASEGPSQTLQAEDHLVAQPGKVNRLVYEDQTEVRLQEDTTLVYEAEIALQEKPSKRLELVQGTVQADVRQQPAGAPLVIKTPHALAIVRGTKFTLSSDANRTRLIVEKGQVDLRRPIDGATVSVQAGMQAFSTKAGDLQAIPQRISQGLLAYYTFQEGQGRRVLDRSGNGAPLDLVVSGKDSPSPEWSSEGLRLKGRGFLESEGAATKIIDACRKSGQFTIEAWVRPTDTTQVGPARIVTMSRTSSNVNAFLAHGASDGAQDAYVVRVRTTRDSDSELRTPNKMVKTRLTHLVFTQDAKGEAKLYVDGELQVKKQIGGNLTNWQRSLKLALGDDPSEQNRYWQGHYRLVAIYDRALSEADLQRNRAAGPDQERVVKW